ncbi:MAG: hypothetical protein V4677_08685 [Bacteroidota bacterium]
MKKIVLVSAGLLSLWLSFGSCKQEYVCSCDKTYITGASMGTSVENYTLYPYTDSRRRADNRCKQNNTTQMDDEGAYDIKCQIK